MLINNPLIEQRADPFIYLHSDGYYYFTASVPEYDRIELRRARHLTELATSNEIVDVWHKPATGAYSDLIWAPEIHHIAGVWYIYFAAAPNREIKDGAFQHRMYAISNTAQNPLIGPWQEPVEIDSGISSFCLDATRFEHNQQQYYVWAQKSPTVAGNSCLYIAPMSSATKLSGPAIMISAPEFDWETQGFLVNEGPAIIKRNGKIFIAYSASATDQRYCMGLLSISDNLDLLNPTNWHKNADPVFTTNTQAAIFGPGHNSFTTSHDGSIDYLVYHARNYQEINGDPLWDPNRHTCIQPFVWDTNGNPSFDKPANRADLSE
jgi:GH43 family beta-xylosidase